MHAGGPLSWTELGVEREGYLAPLASHIPVRILNSDLDFQAIMRVKVGE